MPIRILLVDDHTVVRDALARILHAPPELQVVGRTGSGEEAIALTAQLRPNIVLMDVNMPGMRGPEAAEHILGINDEIRVVMLSASEDELDLLASVQAGASGYLLKTLSGDQLITALKTIHAGTIVAPPQLMSKLLRTTYQRRTASSENRLSREMGSRARSTGQLTGREREILAGVARGNANGEIAEDLGISAHTVKTHIRNIMQKLELDNRAQLIAYALRAGLG